MTGFLTTITLALCAATGQAEGVLIQWKLKAGDIFYTKSVMNLEQTITAMGSNIEQKQDQTIVHRYKVLKASDAGYTIEQTILQSNTESNITTGGLGDIDKKLRGATLTVEMDAKFKVTKIAGTEELVKKLGEDNPLLKQVMASVFSDDSVKMGVESTFRGAPRKSVKVGEEWKSNETVSLGSLGEMSTKIDYKLARSKDGTEEITFGGQAKYGPPKEAKAGALFTVSKADLKSEQYGGSIVFDSKAGRAKETKSEMKLGGAMSVQIGEQTVDMEVKQTIKQSTTFLDKNPVID